MFYFSIYWEFHHPIFQRGRSTTNQHELEFSRGIILSEEEFQLGLRCLVTEDGCELEGHGHTHDGSMVLVYIYIYANIKGVY